MTYLLFLLHYIAMNTINQNKQFLENITHITDTKSYSLHHTYVGPENTNALYLHYHPEMEFLYLHSGSLSFYVEEKKYQLQEGNAIFLPPYLIHNAVKDLGCSCEYSAVVFSSEWLFGSNDLAHNEYLSPLLLNHIDAVCLITKEVPQCARVLSVLKNISKYKASERTSYELMLRGDLLHCFQFLYNHFFSGLTISEEKQTQQKELQKSLSYIHTHYSQRLTLQDIASPSGYSASHFEHLFKTNMGCSPFEYLTKIRMMNACNLLLQGNKKITDIAISCGYDNISYFNRSFKKLMKTTPQGYRKGL